MALGKTVLCGKHARCLLLLGLLVLLSVLSENYMFDVAKQDELVELVGFDEYGN